MGRKRQSDEEFWKVLWRCAFRLLIGSHRGSDGHERILQQACNKARIVYDRFHMQSQFGRDVLGIVRLDEARRHKAKEKEILADISDDTYKETMKSLKQEAKAEKQEYSQLKKLRWSLLTNSYKLSDSKNEQLQSILQDHHDRACKIKCVS